jgi:hypothetical protein
MWISLTGLVIILLFVTLLLVRWRVICTWSGGLVEVRLRFLGLSRKIWSVDLFEHTAVDQARGFQHEQFEKLGSLLGKVVDRIEALLENREIIVRAGQEGLRLARRFRHWWRLDQGTIEFSFGLKNPAHTGITHGTVSALGGMLTARWPQIRVISLPNFDAPAFYTRGEVVFSIRAWDPVRDLIRFAAALPWRGLLKLKRNLAYQ